MEKGKQTYKLPEGWIWTNVSDLFVIIGGGTPTKGNSRYWGGKINWASVKDVKSQYITKTIDKITKEGVENSNTKIAEAGDIILVTRISPGQVSIVKTQTAINQDLKILKLFGDMNPSFVYHLLKSQNHQFIEASSGTTVKGLTVSDLAKIELPLPPLQEQQRIVSKVESLFSELDQAEKGLQKAKQQLEVYRQALLKSAFDGNLTKKWRKVNYIEPAEDLLVRIKKGKKNTYQEELKNWNEAVKRWEKEGKLKPKPKKPKIEQPIRILTQKEIENLPLLPNSWKWVKFGEVCLKLMDGTHFSPKNIEKGKYKYITAKNILEGKIDLGDITYVSEEDHRIIYERCDVKEGDILYVKDGAKTGRAAVNTIKEEFSLLSSVGVFRTFHDKIRPKFLEYYLNAEITRKRMLSQIAGVAITRLTLTKLNNSIFSLCSLMEQDQIVEILESRFTLIENLEKSIQRSLKDVLIFKQSVLKKAFAGKLITQDSTDEPAIMLLQKIRIEKSKYLKAQKELDKLKPIQKRQMDKKKTVLEILKESKEPISTQELWTNSIHEGDIESFYCEIKEIFDQLNEIKEGTESFLSLKK